MIYRSKETVCSITVPRDPEYLALVQDILEHPLVRSMEAYTQHGETSCLRHSINVSYLSYLYCRDHGWQARAAARAGLLHDLFLYDWHFHAKETGNYFHGLTHPRRALENAQRLFSLTDREKNIILRHMWPLTVTPPKYRRAVSGKAFLCAPGPYCARAVLRFGLTALRERTARRREQLRMPFCSGRLTGAPRFP